MKLSNKSNKKIKAVYDKEKVIIYQAFNNEIANEALKLNHFGESFSLNRMTWVKPSFLWMMYRSNWGTKINQERILSIEMERDGFEFILLNAILSKYNNKIYGDCSKWKELSKKSDIICQWDPARDVNGTKLEESTIQLGIRGEILNRYINEWTIKISDVTEMVITMRNEKLGNEFNGRLLPVEEEYPINDSIQYNLGIK